VNNMIDAALTDCINVCADEKISKQLRGIGPRRRRRASDGENGCNRNRPIARPDCRPRTAGQTHSVDGCYADGCACLQVEREE
jgi:hypothetical protein